jgi:hypothetical protein
MINLDDEQMSVVMAIAAPIPIRTPRRVSARDRRRTARARRVGAIRF